MEQEHQLQKPQTPNPCADAVCKREMKPPAVPAKFRALAQPGLPCPGVWEAADLPGPRPIYVVCERSHSEHWGRASYDSPRPALCPPWPPPSSAGHPFKQLL